jgi:hypothetical protein
MKHNQRSASPGELACPHLRDHPTQEAKPTSNDLTDELCTFSAAVGADMRRLTSLPSPGGEDQGEGGLRLFCSLHSKICTLAGESVLSFDIHQNLDFPTRNQFPKLNVGSHSEVAQASGQSGADLPVQRLPASSTRPSTLNSLNRSTPVPPVPLISSKKSAIPFSL